MVGTQNDTDFALSVTKFEKARLSFLYQPVEQRFVDLVTVEDIPYGQKTWMRTVVQEDPDSKWGMKFDRGNKSPVPLYPSVDLGVLYDSAHVDRVTMAGNPSLYSTYASRRANILRDNLDRLLFEGASRGVGPQVIGLLSTFNASTGSVTDPLQCAAVSALGPFTAASNVRAEVTSALVNMSTGGFKGVEGKYLVAPSFVRPHLSQLLSNTAVPLQQWFQSTVGLPILFDDNVDPNASAASFTVAICEPAKVILGTTGLLADSFYGEFQREYFNDFELPCNVQYDVALPNEGSVNSGFYKPVCQINANSI